MLVVRWPDGEETRLTDVAANQLARGEGAVVIRAISTSLVIAAVAVSASRLLRFRRLRLLCPEGLPAP